MIHSACILYCKIYLISKELSVAYYLGVIKLMYMGKPFVCVAHPESLEGFPQLANQLVDYIIQPGTSR